MQTSTHAVGQMSTLFLVLLLTATATHSMDDMVEDEESPPEPVDLAGNGRSFFLLGSLFRRWRDRWLAFHNPAPFYAGAAYPLNGYYNCPSYGCNPAALAPQPSYYPGSYYATSLQPHQQQQQQQTQGNSNVYIYQSDQNNPTALATPPGGGFLGPPSLPPFQPLPNYRPPAGPLPPLQPLPNYRPPTGPLPPPRPPPPSFGCGPPTFACALG